MVLLTTNPNGRLLHALGSTKHESPWVMMSVLPHTTFMELAGMQMAWQVSPTHTQPSVDSEPKPGSFLLTLELVFKVVTLMWPKFWLVTLV